MGMTEVQEWLVTHRPAMARHGLGIVLVLVGLHKAVNPGIWASYVAPQFYGLGLDWTMLMQYSSVVEAGIGLGLMSGWYRRLFSLLAIASILVVVLNLVIAGSFVDLIIRDVGLLMLSLIVLADAFDERQ